MLLKRYGKTYHSVDTNFNPTAITEVGFQRNHRFSVAADELESDWERIDQGEVQAEADGAEQRAVEALLLERLDAALSKRQSALNEGDVLVVENDRDDWPKTRERREVVAEDLDNRFHFHWRIEPGLRMAVYRRRQK